MQCQSDLGIYHHLPPASMLMVFKMACWACVWGEEGGRWVRSLLTLCMPEMRERTVFVLVTYILHIPVPSNGHNLVYGFYRHDF